MFHAFHSDYSKWCVVRVSLSRPGCGWGLLAGVRAEELAVHSCLPPLGDCGFLHKEGQELGLGWLFLSLPFPDGIPLLLHGRHMGLES